MGFGVEVYRVEGVGEHHPSIMEKQDGRENGS